MEYATRAGATTSRYYGETDELLGNYAWFNKNTNDSIQPVGIKKPNDLGLFDSQGNCYTWCQESYRAYPVQKENAMIEDKEDMLQIIPTTSRVLRGGAFGNPSSRLRSAHRVSYVPADHVYNYGFRPSRTLKP
jgi:formylglycine-generating enzyme required for sulfatase activity